MIVPELPALKSLEFLVGNGREDRYFVNTRYGSHQQLCDTISRVLERALIDSAMSTSDRLQIEDYRLVLQHVVVSIREIHAFQALAWNITNLTHTHVSQWYTL